MRGIAYWHVVMRCSEGKVCSKTPCMQLKLCEIERCDGEAGADTCKALISLQLCKVIVQLEPGPIVSTHATNYDLTALKEMGSFERAYFLCQNGQAPIRREAGGIFHTMTRSQLLSAPGKYKALLYTSPRTCSSAALCCRGFPFLHRSRCL